MNKREKNNIATRFTVNVILVDKDKECSLYLPQRQQQKRKDWSWSLATWMWNGSHSQQPRALCQPPAPERGWNDQLLDESNFTKWSRLSLLQNEGKEAKIQWHVVVELPWHIPARMSSFLEHFLFTGSAPLLRGVVGLQDHPLLIQPARCLCV